MTKFLPVFFAIFLLTSAASFAQDGAARPVGAPVYLTANDLSIATGEPSLVAMSTGSAFVPVWSLSGGTVGQSVAGIVPGFSAECRGVKVEIVVTNDDPGTNADVEDVFRVHLSQLVPGETFKERAVVGNPVRTALPDGPFKTRTITLESYYPVVADAPITVRIQREPGDPADSFLRPDGLALVKITPLGPLNEPKIVEDAPGYNSWPMTQAVGNRLICVYGRGSGHTVSEDSRFAYSRSSDDGGETWTPETLVASTPGFGEVAIGKGLDSTGAALFWIRRVETDWDGVVEHDLYRTTDGATFERIATPELDPAPVQITDVFAVPGVGLMALWFAGNYGPEPTNSWGTLVSADDGKTWTQKTVESGLAKADWPTEPSAAYLGDGRIIALARTELGDATTNRAQFQLTSTDNGATWKRARTNIGDVLASSPSLIFEKSTGLLSAYYYHRGRGVVRRRVVDPSAVFENPLAWPDSEGVASGSASTWDAGNVNATKIGDVHYLAYYSGDPKNASVVTAAVAAPKKKTDGAPQSAE